MIHVRRVRRYSLRILLALTCLSALQLKQGLAQDRTRVNGLSYLDYYYNFLALDDSLEGQNGFTYRRLYLSASHTFSDEFSAFARLEATESSIQPFVKDLYLRWNWNPVHTLRFGIVPPPVFDVTEDVWDYRSLEKTVLDLFDIVSSRDMGIRADGALLGDDKLSYAVMVANNNSVNPEEYRGKRVYGQLVARPLQQLVLTASADYAELAESAGDAYRISGLVGYVSSAFRAGLEPFWHQTGFETTEGMEQIAGVSAFASGWFSERWGIVGRFDRVVWTNSEAEGAIYAIGGIAFRPHSSVRFIPNAYLTKSDEVDDVNLTGRMTLEFEF